jgi:uncharacterized repeat protein (TIGR01451 family)
MKKILYLFIQLLMICSQVAQAQYHITGVTVNSVTCSGYSCTINTNAYALGLSVKTYSRNSYAIDTVTNLGSYGAATYKSYINDPGLGEFKHVLYSSGVAVDSVLQSYDFLNCNTFTVQAFNDASGTGIYNSVSDPLMRIPISVQVGKNGVIIDTIAMTSGNYFQISGLIGDIYSFKLISVPVNYTLTCPAGGIIYDTIQSTTNGYPIKYFGLNCLGTGFDLAVNAAALTTNTYHQRACIYVTNASCVPENATVTLDFSPKYNGIECAPNPSSLSGSTAIWNLTGIIAEAPRYLDYDLWDGAGDLMVGDTVHGHITITPTSGDANPTNNIEIIIDTVTDGVDPNEMSVSPSGIISSGTQLKYTIGFENTGNDTAFNISVYDTLSDKVNVQSLNFVMASAVMNIAVLQGGGHNIVKFDFPNINLLDSSHHGQCNGAVIFTVNTKQGLPNGTKIDNEAGIYFDYNPVVMTNMVENVIGVPTSVATVNNEPKVTIYPNPANDELTVKTENGAYNAMTITNTIGQTLIHQEMNSALTKVDVHALPVGVYYISLRGENGVSVQKFIKQ